MEYSVDTIKKTILYFHGFYYRNTKEITKEIILDEIRNIGIIQIDTINVVQRSQYLVLWSRLGYYNTFFLDELIYKDKKLFEYWFHCASIIPIELYQYRKYKMIEYKKGIKKDSEETTRIFKHIKANENARALDFTEKKTGDGWWNWKPSKKVLESLYNSGELMVDNRQDFQKIYNTKEKVLPKYIIKQKPVPYEESIKFLLEFAAKKLGIFFINDICYFSFIKKTEANPFIKQLLSEKVIIEILVNKGVDVTFKMYIHSNNISVLNSIHKKRKTEKVFFISPFDSFLWSKKRILEVFNFEQILEAYKKKENRKWGYFCLPILYNSNLIGRIDSQVERKSKTIILKNISIEKEFDISRAFLHQFCMTLRSFMLFNDADNVLLIQKNNITLKIHEICLNKKININFH